MVRPVEMLTGANWCGDWGRRREVYSLDSYSMIYYSTHNALLPLQLGPGSANRLLADADPQRCYISPSPAEGTPPAQLWVVILGGERSLHCISHPSLKPRYL